MNASFIRPHLGALALAATLILAACGGGDASPPAESVPPTVNISSSVVSGAAAGPVTFTFTFSEDVGSSFSADTVSVSNGTKGAFTKVSNTQYTLVVTPTANSAGNLGVSIAANTVQDLVGNKMPVAAAQTQGYDTRPPTVAITNDAATGTARGAVTFTFNFSKDVGTSFTADDVVVTGGAKGAFARVSSTQFTLVVTPAANSSGTLSVSIASGAFADAGGTTNPAAGNTQLAFDTRPSGPTDAPGGTIPAGSVVIYSEAATVPGFNARPDWGQTVAYSEATIAGNKSLKYTFQGGGFGAPGAYEGLDWSANPVNVATKTKLHMDLWSNDLTSLKISIISAGKENAVTQAITKGSWNSVDIDLSAYNVPDKTAIIQIKIESATAGDIYIDNIYFWGGAASGCGSTAPTCAPTTTVPSGSVVIYSEAAKVAGFNPRPDWGQSVAYSEATIAGNKSLKYTFQGGGFGAPGAYEGLDWAANPVNVASKTKLHMDLWSNDLTSLKISIISAGKENAVTQAITKGSWNSVDIDLSAYNVPDKTAIIQIKIESATAGDVYIDNIYFWGGAAVGCGTTVPTCAPTTSIPTGSVVIYSEAATVPNFNARPDWGQSVTFSEVTIAGNKSLKYTFQGGGFGAPGAYEGLDWAANPVNVASKGKLHMDLWSADIASMKISIISAGKENAVTQAITPGSWNSVDIDLASYTVPDKSAIIQIKIESATAGTVYIDNIHFWGTGSSSGGGGANPNADPGSAGPVTIPVATTADKFGFILANDAIFAADYIGPKDGSGNSAMFPGATTTGAAANGNIGYYNDNLLSTSGQKLEEGGWVSGSIDQQGVPNFFRYFVLTGPGSTFSSSFMGLFVNAPNNGTVNVSSYANIKFKLWGPAEMYEKTNLNPTLELIFAGPKVAGCTATGSGGTEISKTFVANQKIGAGSSYKVSLTGWTVKGVCGSDTTGTAVASVLSKLARVVFNVPGSSMNFVNVNPGTPTSYSSGINLGPIGFTNQ